jgi:hypothetical protein
LKVLEDKFNELFKTHKQKVEENSKSTDENEKKIKELKAQFDKALDDLKKQAPVAEKETK